MKSALMLLVLSFATLSQAKTLNVSCSDKEGRSVELVSEIVNVAQPQQIKSLAINGTDVDKYRDVSQTPIYSAGVISIAINIGYNSVSLKLQNCEDSFLAQGSGVLKRYVGGFAGTLPSDLKCSCELK